MINNVTIIDKKGNERRLEDLPFQIFQTYRPKCDRCGCYLTDDNRVNDLCKACDEYLEQSQAKPKTRALLQGCEQVKRS